MTKQRKRRHESGTPEKEEETTEELKAFINEKTGEAVKEIKRALDQKIRGLEDSLNFAYESISVTSQKVAVLEKELKVFNYEWQDMKHRIANLEREREENDKLRRRSQLIFSGRDLQIPDFDDRLVAAVSAQINRLLELDIPPGEIVNVKRLPGKRLLVKFSRDDKGSLRDEVFKAKSRLRGQSIYISENLTPARHEAFNLLLHERREGRLSTVLTRGGEVFFAVCRNDRLTRVRSREEVENILRQFRFAEAEPTSLAASGNAPASDPPRSRDRGQTAGPQTEESPQTHGESTREGESPTPTRACTSGERPPPGRRGTGADQLGPPRTESPGSHPTADRRSVGGTEVTRRGFTADSAAESASGSVAGGCAPRLSGLAPPLTERSGADRPEDRRNGDAEAGEVRREEAPSTGGSLGPRGEGTKSVSLDSFCRFLREIGSRRVSLVVK